MRPVIHASLQTTPWQSLGTVTGLKAGEARFRWLDGRPELVLISAEWVAASTIPWSALPADAKIDTLTRATAVLTQENSLVTQVTATAWMSGIYLGPTASPAPMRGMITWSIRP